MSCDTEKNYSWYNDDHNNGIPACWDKAFLPPPPPPYLFPPGCQEINAGWLADSFTGQQEM